MTASICPEQDGPSPGGAHHSTSASALHTSMDQPPVATILIVDDEADIVTALGRGLERGIPGVRVLAASSGHAALEILARQRVDVVISDNKMPGMLGIDFLVQARAVSPGATRMMLTAYPEERLLERSVNDARVRYFFTKPYTLVDIVASVKAALADQRERARHTQFLAQGIAARVGRA